ncbi:MAG: YkgJ family cysteine cluster protein, partial [Nanoarchaeota archaeon]|nr:YkgJ family cysteine cluster protein [Nanoarchaeota archaeon]
MRNIRSFARKKRKLRQTKKIINFLKMIICEECPGACCKILVVEIDTPETKEEYENILCYLYHKDVKIYIDTDNTWNVQFNTQCKQLDENGNCKIYSERPPVCRESKVEECHINKKEIKKIFNDADEYSVWLKNKNNSNIKN